MMRNKGFTLIEISIVLVIIGLLMAGVIKGMSFVQSAKITNAITLAQDLSAAVNIFKQQYHMLPGDISITTEIPNVRNECKSGGSNAGNNDGLIDPTESLCVPEVLFQAGLAKVDQEGSWAVFKSYYGPVTVKAANLLPYLAASIAAGTFPAAHVVEFANLPCSVVQAMDRKIDNDILTSGKAIADLTGVADLVNPNTCAADSIVPFYAMAL